MRKSTIIIVLIAIFVLGSIILHAVDIRVNNIYRYNWGTESVTFDGEERGAGTHEIHKASGSTSGFPDPFVCWYNETVYGSSYDCIAAQDDRSVSGVRWTMYSWWKFTLPGQWEPIPDDPPEGD